MFSALELKNINMDILLKDAEYQLLNKGALGGRLVNQLYQLSECVVDACLIGNEE